VINILLLLLFVVIISFWLAITLSLELRIIFNLGRKTKILRNLNIFLILNLLTTHLFYLSQNKFSLNILSECVIFGCKPTNFLKDHNNKLALSNYMAYDDDSTHYQRLVDPYLS